jgi:hypothetical protein
MSITQTIKENAEEIAMRIVHSNEGFYEPVFEDIKSFLLSQHLSYLLEQKKRLEGETNIQQELDHLSKEIEEVNSLLVNK